jgi:hypothetical protein
MPTVGFVGFLLLLAGAAAAQTPVAGRVVDETGLGIAGVRVELRSGDGVPAVASSDAAGNFHVTLPAAGDYTIRAERLGFYLYQGKTQRFEAQGSELTISLNHLQEFSDRIDVTYSPPAIDPVQPSERRELTGTEMQTVPYPAPQDYRNSLQLIGGVVMDNFGRPHVNGGQSSQTNFTMNGFNISNPVTGRLDTRVNIETIQSMEVETSRFAAENGRGSAGVMDVATRMGDDRFRFGITNFIPSISADGGWRMNKWTPRLQFSGPLKPGRLWFHNGFDAFYSNDVVNGLPKGENQTKGLTTSNLTRVQANLTRSNSLTAGFLFNLQDASRMGLSFVLPSEATTNRRQTLYMTTLRDQWYFPNGALLDAGFADTRGTWSDLPQGDSVYQITPYGNRGNFFVHLDRHFYRKQWLLNLFLPVLKAGGTHLLKAGIDVERESFHQKNERHPYEVLRADDSVARRVTFDGSPFQGRTNTETSHYIQDSWTPFDGLSLELGLRLEWSQVVRNYGVAPRFAAAWSPRGMKDTKLAAGWGIYYDSISLEPLAREQDQESISTFYPPSLGPRGPVTTTFLVDQGILKTPSLRNSSVSIERKLPHDVYLKTGYMRRSGNHGLTFVPAGLATPPDLTSGTVQFQLHNVRRDRYDAWDISLRHTFAGRFELSAGYTRSSARSSAAVDYSLENPIFAPQAPGPYPWDTPHRFLMWGWAPLPLRALPARLRLLTRNTTASYLFEWRTGFPFNIVDEESLLVGSPNSVRMPAYFNINLHLEREFRALHYLWAWRFGFNNLTNNGNPNTVNNVMGTPSFLAFGRGQTRAFSVRLRLLGRK